MEIRRSDDRLISTMVFPILVRPHIYIESGPWCCSWPCHLHTWREALDSLIPGPLAIVAQDDRKKMGSTWYLRVVNRGHYHSVKGRKNGTESRGSVTWKKDDKKNQHMIYIRLYLSWVTLVLWWVSSHYWDQYWNNRASMTIAVYLQRE